MGLAATTKSTDATTDQFLKISLIRGHYSLCTVFLVKNSLRPKIQKVLPQSIPGHFRLGMGICEWGKVEFFNFGLPLLALTSVKGPE